jgi:hypothetical protein
MLAAAETYVRLRGTHRVLCAKLNHATARRCIFRCDFGAHLRVTGLRAADGPGIELLEYLAPRDGRPFPADERANDLVHWQTRLVARDATGVEKLGQGRPVALPAHELGLRPRDDGA